MQARCVILTSLQANNKYMKTIGNTNVGAGEEKGVDMNHFSDSEG